MKSRSENKRRQEKEQSLKSIGHNQISLEVTKTEKTTEKELVKRNNNNSNNNTNVNNGNEAQRMTGNKGHYSSKSKVKVNNKSLCGRAENSQNAGKKGEQKA